MSSLVTIPPLIPLPLKYRSDDKLSEGRIIFPMILDFSLGEIEDSSGNFYTSTQVIQTSSVQSTVIYSAIKGICVRYNTYNNHVLRIRCNETNADWVLGNPVVQTAPTTQNYVVNARIPMFLPPNATLYFTNYRPATDPPSTDMAKVQLTNFEVLYGVSLLANPFGNAI